MELITSGSSGVRIPAELILTATGRGRAAAVLRRLPLRLCLDVRSRLLSHAAIHWGRLTRRRVASARIRVQLSHTYGMYFLYV